MLGDESPRIFGERFTLRRFPRERSGSFTNPLDWSSEPKTRADLFCLLLSLPLPLVQGRISSWIVWILVQERC